MSKRGSPAKLVDVAALEERLREAEETLEAIRTGQVEALVVSTAEGPKVYTLEGADHRYRRLVETMNEGALLVSPAGLLLYGNAAFAAMVGCKLQAIIGRSLLDFLEPQSKPTCAALIGAAARGPAAGEVLLRATDGHLVPAYLSLSPNDDGTPGVSAIVTNLAAQKRNEEVVASERLAASILDQAAEALVVCDSQGVVVRASRAAREISAGEPLRRHVFDAYPLRGTEGDASTPHPATVALRGELSLSLEMVLEVPGRPAIHVLCTAAPLTSEHMEVRGCVMSITDITRQKQAATERAELLEAERAARMAAERARAELEATSRSKDEFIATVSHELRTPLNAIVGWSRLLSEGTLAPEKQKHAVVVIRRNADAQARLIEDLLDVSRIISGKMRLDVRPVETTAVVRAVIETVRPALDAKAIELVAELDEEETSVLADGTRLQQIVWNLLANASKFTPKGGRVRVGLRRVDANIEIAVEDNGQGIAAGFLPYVFDRFRQADGAMSRVHGGLGLGLAITRHLVEIHGGSIAVRSDGPGRGATFLVRLPRAATRESSLPAERVSTRDLRDEAPPLDCANLTGVHVLVVEDDDDSRDLLVAILNKCGARISQASSGADALARLAKGIPDVLVSDIGMPKMDGYAFIRNVRQMDDDAARRLPALALTAYSRDEDRQRALAEGFQMHMAKPVDAAAFAVAVARLAGLRH